MSYEDRSLDSNPQTILLAFYDLFFSAVRRERYCLAAMAEEVPQQTSIWKRGPQKSSVRRQGRRAVVLVILKTKFKMLMPYPPVVV